LSSRVRMFLVSTRWHFGGGEEQGEMREKAAWGRRAVLQRAELLHALLWRCTVIFQPIFVAEYKSAWLLFCSVLTVC